MKTLIPRLIRALATQCGLRITRLSGPHDPFKAMQRVLVGIDEPIIFDVGAHHGCVSQLFRQLFPSARIYAFEPFQKSFEALRESTCSDSKIHSINCGLGDRSGKQWFYSNQCDATNSLLATDELGIKTWGENVLETKATVQIEIDTIDSVVARMQIPRIDILKLDVQGAEHLVIAGAAATCQRGMIGLVYAEIITQPSYKGQKRLDDALRVFYESGFNLFNIYNLNNSAEGRLRQVDVLFTRAVV